MCTGLSLQEEEARETQAALLQSKEEEEARQKAAKNQMETSDDELLRQALEESRKTGGTYSNVGKGSAAQVDLPGPVVEVISMGFSREQAQFAYEATGGEIEAMIQLLTSNMG